MILAQTLLPLEIIIARHLNIRRNLWNLTWFKETHLVLPRSITPFLALNFLMAPINKKTIRITYHNFHLQNPREIRAKGCDSKSIIVKIRLLQGMKHPRLHFHILIDLNSMILMCECRVKKTLNSRTCSCLSQAPQKTYSKIKSSRAWSKLAN